MNHLPNLTGTPPADVLIHGPSKLLVDKYLYHLPDIGIIASYTPTHYDVHDHFGIFRGVDQIESFAQATIVSCSSYLESIKNNCSLVALKEMFTPIFISIGQVNFRSYLQQGDTFIIIGLIKSYKFRQMNAEGRIYKAPPKIDLEEYFENFTAEKLTQYDLEKNFTLIAELFDVTGRGIKNNK